ncbi:MAG TPA: hypothetical protein VJW55_14535 [Candidatus Angelobacter sp.]|jgi:hypothetical protein|nr:hypothetical protein [Candidatus Angelobacter sp.]
MKKVFSFVTIVCLATGLALAQTGGDKAALNPQPLPPGKKASTTTATTKTETTKSGKKGHKTNAKSKKGSTSTTPPPK